MSEIMSAEVTDQSGQQQEQLAASVAENYPSHDSLYTQLRTQVEFYFSPKNLSRDTYLRTMLTSDHVEMPTPRPMQLMCPVGIITNFPKIKFVCSQFGAGQEKKQVEPAALLLARALDGGSNIVSISPDGNWIGPTNQILPPSMIGGAVGVGVPPWVPPPFQTHPYQHQQPGIYNMPNHIQGMIGMAPSPPPPLPPIRQDHQHGEGQGFMFQNQQPGTPYVMGMSQVGSEGPLSASVESLLQQQQQTNGSDLPPWRAPMGPMSSEPLSSTSDPVLVIGHQGAGGVYPLPPEPSQSPPMMVNQNASMPPPYPIAPLMHQLSQPSSMMGGMQQISHPYLYYHPQQMQKVVYPQQGVPQQPTHQPQMLPYPPHHQMGYGGSLQQPPQHVLPPYFAYPGMQQYVDYGRVGCGSGSGGGGGRGGLQSHGYPRPPRQFHDNRRGAGSPGFHRSNDYSLNYDVGGQKNRVDKKKQKNHQEQHRQQQQQRGESYGSSSAASKESGNDEFNNHVKLQVHNQPLSQPTVEHQRGEGANKSSWKKNREQHSQFRRNHGDAAPVDFSSKDHNRHQEHHQISQLKQLSKADENREIFSSSDFPGLGGGENQQQQRGEKKENSHLVGYASALLKKKVASNDVDLKIDTCNNATAPVPATQPTSVEDEVDSHTNQMEEMEREILSEFHDLSLLGNDYDNDSNNNQQSQELCHNRKTHDETAGSHTTLGTASSSTTSTNHSLPILPAEHIGNDTASEEINSQADDFPISESSSSKSEPIIDLKNAVESPTGESLNNDHGVGTVGASGLKQQTAQPPSASDDLGSAQQHSKGAWGSKRLFADVIKDGR